MSKWTVLYPPSKPAAVSMLVSEYAGNSQVELKADDSVQAATVQGNKYAFI